MGDAFFWGAFGGAALVLGALAAVWLPFDARVVGMVMAIGAGVLISAVAFDLVEEAVDTADGEGAVALGLAAGALTFFAGDAVIDRLGGDDRKRMRGEPPASSNLGSDDRKRTRGDPPASSSLGIALGAVLDGIPESIVLGVGLLAGGGVSVAFVAAVFISNLPEGLAATTGLVASGWSTARVVALWTGVALVSAVAALIGYGAFDGASSEVLAFVLAFAGGAVLTMLADTMMPEAFAQAGRVAGLCTTAGFAVAFALHLME
jgi:ZIP family zinc transporter